MPRLRESHISRAKATFDKVLSPEAITEVARETRFVQRQRVATAAGIYWAFMVTLGALSAQYISDVLRTMNRREETCIRYKPFWDRLVKSTFPNFMRAMFERLAKELAWRVVQRKRESTAHFFSDILIDDGSSFAVADGLRKVFPGRFNKIKPAAIELHAHMSVCSDNLLSVQLSADKESERAFLPPATELPRRSLSIRDRGYIDRKYFADLEGTGAYLLCRARSDLNPVVEKATGVSRRLAKSWAGKKLKEIPKSKLRQGANLLVSWKLPGGRKLKLWLIIRYKHDPSNKKKRKRSKKRQKRATSFRWLYLLTNVPPEVCNPDQLVQLYGLRWQIELVFKEWKSYANLKAFQSEKKNIVEGFIWASLCAALLKRALAHVTQYAYGQPISTRITAQSGAHILPQLADWAQRRGVTNAFEAILSFLAGNARRTHPERDRKRPQNSLGLKFAKVPDS